MPSGLLRTCGIVSGGLVVSRISGMLKLAVVAALFGTGDAMDAFLVATALPLALVTVFGEAVYVATVKLVSRHRGERSDGWGEVGALVNVTVLAGIAASALYWAFSPLLVRIIAPGFPAGLQSEACRLARCAAPIILLGTVQQVFHGILHARCRFAVVAMQLGVANAVAIGTVWCFSSSLGVGSYAIGMVLGDLVCCVVTCMAALRGGARYVFSFDCRCRGLRDSLHLGWPVAIGMGTLQATCLTDRWFASALPAGSISALGYALLLLTVPLSFVRTVVDVAFPALAGIFHERGGERERRLGEAVRAYLKALVMVGAPVSVMLVLWRQPLIGILLQRGRFDAASTDATSRALLFYALGLMPLAFRHFLTRLSQSAGDSLTPLPSNVASLGANLLLNFALVPILGHAAIALSLTACTVVGTGLLFVQLRRKVPALRVPGLVSAVARPAGAAAAMLAAYFAAERLGGSFVFAGLAGGAAYAAGLAALGAVGARRVPGRAAPAQVSPV